MSFLLRLKWQKVMLWSSGRRHHFGTITFFLADEAVYLTETLIPVNHTA